VYQSQADKGSRMMNKDLMNLALRLALKSVGHYRLGAVVAKRCRVLGTGFNKPKSHPLMQKYNKWEGQTPGIHAELDAILGLDANDLLGAEIYVARIMKNGLPAISRPCEICQRLLRAIGIRTVYFTVQEGWDKIKL